jgi:hypothetical protein
MDKLTVQELRKAADMAGLSMEFAEVLANSERYEWLRTAGAWESEIAMDALSLHPEQFDAMVDERMGEAR